MNKETLEFWTISEQLLNKPRKAPENQLEPDYNQFIPNYIGSSALITCYPQAHHICDIFINIINHGVKTGKFPVAKKFQICRIFQMEKSVLIHFDLFDEKHFSKIQTE